MNKKYDVFVIGSGMAGMTVANRCADKGLEVGITDELPYGGTCALRGCDPKKVIIGATEAQDFCRRLAGKGIESVPRLNWNEIMKFKQTFVKDTPGKIEKGYKNKEIHTFHSPAKFLDRNLLEVGDEVVEAEKFVIAAGAKPRTLPFEGGSHAMTSTDFLNLKELPESILFIGGGYIAFEFAQIAARAGASVTILHRGKRPLKGFDPDLVALLVEETTNLDVKIVLQTEATRIEARNSSFIVQGNCKGKLSEFHAGAVFNAAGRPPSIADLDLE